MTVYNVVLKISVFVMLITQCKAKLEDCALTEEIVCYYCDSHHNEHCGNPFEYSHYYISTEVYMAACYGCCIKVTHPEENGERRIIRSCIEHVSHLNITSTDDCHKDDKKNTEVCACGESYCNAANARNSNSLPLILLTIVSLLSVPGV